MKAERLHQIEEYLRNRQVATIPELCEKFDVSVNTIRRDLNTLKDQKKIEKIYGGAQIRSGAGNGSDPLAAYADRNVIHSRQKECVARSAASCAHENDIIFIDTGTSTVPILKYLNDFHHLTIVTNSIYILYSSLEFPQFTIIGLPGMLKHKTASLVGDECLRSIDLYNIDTAFMAASAFSLEGGASNSSLEELSIKKKIMEHSTRRILLLDNSKLERSSLVTFARPDEFETIILDTLPPKHYIQYCSEHGIQLMIAGSAP